MNTVAEALELAVRQHQAGNLQQAEQGYRQILQLAPENVDALHLLGLIALQTGHVESAIELISRTLRFKPDFAEAHNNLGIALHQQGKSAEAEASWRQAVALKPNYAEAHNHLGTLLAGCGTLDQAVACFRQAISVKPDYVDAHQNLVNALNCLGRLDEAVVGYRELLRLKPDSAETCLDLGNALKRQGKRDEAIASYEQAIRLKPDFVGAIYNLGNTLKEQGKLTEAVTSYQDALRLKPDYVEVHNNLGIALLLLGDFEQGWPEYEWRLVSQQPPPQTFSQPLWDGSPLASATILLHMEQGWGDTLQFIRYVSLIKKRVGRVALACPLSLVDLLSTCPGLDWLPSQTCPLPEFDVHAPLLSLPGILKTSLATVPANVPYLFADAKRIDDWRQALNGPTKLKIGIAWQGNPTYLFDHQRSIPLQHFSPVARLAEIELYSLQKGFGAEQLAAAPSGWNIIDLGSRLDRVGGAFLDTAAVMKNLDLVITSDTAIAHLAGALGVPVWVALAFVPDWRWMLHREDSPWYPTMRLFRQPDPGNWPAVFQSMAAELHKRF